MGMEKKRELLEIRRKKGEAPRLGDWIMQRDNLSQLYLQVFCPGWVVVPPTETGPGGGGAASGKPDRR